jgi:radical SAM superfamily enzyme YgiQ (UPF0313 family)
LIRVALIWPFGFDPKCILPLGPAYIKSNLDPNKYDVKIFDCSLGGVKEGDDRRFTQFIKGFSPHIVGVTAWASVFKHALHIVRQTKKIDSRIITVMGGYHSTCYADKIIQHSELDYIIKGEGEEVFPIFLEECQKAVPNFESVEGIVYKNEDGSIYQNGIAVVNDLENINWPDYDAINIEKYFKGGYRYLSLKKRNIPLIATRGCPYECAYCSAPIVSGRRVRKYSVEKLINHIEYLYKEKNIRWFNFIDDNFTSDLKFAKSLTEAIIDLNLKGVRFGTPSGVRMVKNGYKLWSSMKQAGWEEIIIAPESGSKHILNLMNKKLDLDSVPRVVKDIKSAGLNVTAYFIVGYPGETKEDLQKTLKFIKKNNFDFVSMHNFQPIPGTPVYEFLVRSGEINEGLLPGKYGYGSRVYTPKELNDVNFCLVISKVYFVLFLKKPFKMLKKVFCGGFGRVLLSMFSNITGIFKLRGSNG